MPPISYGATSWRDAATARHQTPDDRVRTCDSPTNGSLATITSCSTTGGTFKSRPRRTVSLAPRFSCTKLLMGAACSNMATTASNTLPQGWHFAVAVRTTLGRHLYL